MRLKRMWDKYAYHTGLDPHFSGAIWQVLVGLYKLPHTRSYHTLDWHILHMLDDFYKFNNSHPDFTDSWNEVEWAIWFHDIYDNVTRDDNEESSGYLASALSIEHTKLNTLLIDILILATRHMVAVPPGVRNEVKLIRDLDLMGFVAPMDIFLESQRRIRAEHPRHTDKEYREGRTYFLQHLLNRGYVFLLDEFKPLEGLATERIEGIIAGKYD